MFEGFIAGKLAENLFKKEKEIFKSIKSHAMWASLIMMIPDFGLGVIAFVFILWHMYSSVCKKVGVNFSDHFWTLVGVGMFVNIAIALVIDITLTFLFFLEPFLIYMQFYLSGKAFYKSLHELKLKPTNSTTYSTPPKQIQSKPQPQLSSRISTAQPKAKTNKSADLQELDSLLQSGVISTSEYENFQKEILSPQQVKELQEINGLLQAGVISTTEYDNLKKELLH